jgi:hypothetical protein
MAVISFQDALEATKDKDRTLLIGNGFSAAYFAYRDLLAASGLPDDGPIRALFGALDTVDFEKVIYSLEVASTVEVAYGNADHSQQLTDDAQVVREALVQAINHTHPGHREDVSFASCAEFLDNFGSVFSLNYDLLLYWAVLEKNKLHDGFGLGEQAGAFRGPFRQDAYCEIYNLHGGLHLFSTVDGEIEKALHTGNGVIATISAAIVGQKRLPVYIAEGTSRQKMLKIDTISYLRHCYSKLRENAAAVFVYGHSADDNDAHIYRAIFESNAKQLFFGVYQPDEAKLKVFEGQLAKYKAVTGSEIDYAFFDSASAEVWAA